MCNELMHTRPAFFYFVLDCLKTQEMGIKAVEVDQWQLYDVPDHFKKQKICDKAVSEDPYSLQYVPDWFLTQEHVKIWHCGDDYCNDDGIIEFYEAYKKMQGLEGTNNRRVNAH